MSIRDVFSDLASIAVPAPYEPSDPEELSEIERDVLNDALWEASGEWDSYRTRLKLAADEGDVDPVLSELAAARRTMREAEQRMRLVLAYAREYVKPRPYRLEDLADATGISISGVRKAYGGEEVGAVYELITNHPGARLDTGDRVANES